MKIYIVCSIAIEFDSNKVHQMVELATKDKAKAESYLLSLPKNNIITLDGAECFTERSVFNVDLEE